MIAHTKEPWYAVNDGIGWRVYADKDCNIQVNDGDKDTFNKYDALLIAEVPYLLDLARQVILASQDDDRDTRSAMLSMCADIAQNIIDRVECRE